MLLKAFAAVALTAIIVYTLISSNSAIGNVLSEAGSRISTYIPEVEPDGKANRTISFSIWLEPYEYSAFSAYVNGNVTVKSDRLRLEVNGDEVKTERPIKIVGYKGALSLNSDSFELDGVFGELRLGDITFKSKGHIKSGGFYESIGIEELTVQEILLKGKGYVEIDSMKLDVDTEDVKITSPKGLFSFSSVMAAGGKAAKIEVGGLRKG